MSTMRKMNPRLDWFVEQMQRKLRDNTDKSEPRDMPLRELKSMLNAEMKELTYAIRWGDEQDIIDGHMPEVGTATVVV
jgi:hypothetical protein